MKRFLMYLVVAIVLVVTGVSIYYVVRNDEQLTSLLPETNIYYMNVGETLPIPINRQNPASYTNIVVANPDEYNTELISVDIENWTITALKAGVTTVSFTTDNEEFNNQHNDKNSENKADDLPFEVICYIGNGSQSTPYYIRNEDDIMNIGKGSWHYYDNYELTTDITLSGPMLPIGLTDENGELRYTTSADGTKQIVIDNFEGSFSGGSNRHKISNVKIYKNNLPFATAGFFAIVGEKAKIENVVFENVEIDGSFYYAGAIAGVNYGLIGMCEANDVKITNKLEQFGYSGGIAGLNQTRSEGYYASINACTVSNLSIDSKYRAGGAVGRNSSGEIVNCLVKIASVKLDSGNYNPETQSLRACFGGLIGLSGYSNESGTIFHSTAKNNIIFLDKIDTPKNSAAGAIGMYYSSSNAKSKGDYSNLLFIGKDLPNFVYQENETSLDARRITIDEALNKSTYGDEWDLQTMWELTADEEIKLGYNRTDDNQKKTMTYQTFVLRTDTIEITDANSLKKAIDTMRSYPMANKVYKIKESVVYDGNKLGNAWTPIGTYARPFVGQIISEKGATISFKNLNIEGEYAGIFGCTSGVNTLIEGIRIMSSTAKDGNEMFNVSGSVAAAGIVGFNSYATIRDCYVGLIDVKTGKYAGFVAGINTGTIKNCYVNAEKVESDEQENLYKSSIDVCMMGVNPTDAVNIYLGGVAGLNKGRIENVATGSVNIEIEDNSNKNMLIGGIAGENNGIINIATVDQITISGGAYKGEGYVGGIVGLMSSGEADYLHVFEANNIIFPLDNKGVVVGGLAGCLLTDSKICGGVVGTLTAKANAVGGLGGVVNGVIEQSYVSNSAEIIAGEAGGFAVKLNGTIDNCMTAVKAQVTNRVAGMSVHLNSNGLVRYSYIDPTFSIISSTGGLLDKFLSVKDTVGLDYNISAETFSPFRSQKGYGRVENCVIVGSYNGTSIPGINFEVLPRDCININGMASKLQTAFLVWGNSISKGEIMACEASQLSNGDIKALEDAGFNTTAIWQNSDNGYAIPAKAASVYAYSGTNASVYISSISLSAKNVEAIKLYVNGHERAITLTEDLLNDGRCTAEFNVYSDEEVILKIKYKAGCEPSRLESSGVILTKQDSQNAETQSIEESFTLSELSKRATIIVEAEQDKISISGKGIENISITAGENSYEAMKTQGENGEMTFDFFVNHGEKLTIEITYKTGFSKESIVAPEGFVFVESKMITVKENNADVQKCVETYNYEGYGLQTSVQITPTAQCEITLTSDAIENIKITFGEETVGIKKNVGKNGKVTYTFVVKLDGKVTIQITYKAGLVKDDIVVPKNVTLVESKEVVEVVDGKDVKRLTETYTFENYDISANLQFNIKEG